MLRWSPPPKSGAFKDLVDILDLRAVLLQLEKTDLDGDRLDMAEQALRAPQHHRLGALGVDVKDVEPRAVQVQLPKKAVQGRALHIDRTRRRYLWVEVAVARHGQERRGGVG